MAGWGDILKEIGEHPSPLDLVRRKYLKDFSDYTGRNVIIYYSAFLSMNRGSIDINDNDINGFMNAFKGLDFSKGLDLIFHTPGGSPAAAEAIISYIKSEFGNDFRVIVPQIAMSAGTMMACASKEIFMGKHSSLGPIDPQFNGIPAYNVIDEFNDAKKELHTDSRNATFWALRLQQYPAAFLKQAFDAIALSSELITKWLGSNMFDAVKDKSTIKNIVDNLNEHKNSKLHGRHFDVDMCRSFGLKIRAIEEDDLFQDKVLSIHHATMLTLERSGSSKIIENQIGGAMIFNGK